MSYKLNFSPKMTRKDSHDMILNMMRYGSYPHDIGSGTDADLIRCIESMGLNFNSLVDHCRVWPNTVPNIENIAPSMVTIDPSPGTLPFNFQYGETIVSVTGPMKLSTHNYLGLFESSLSDRDNAIEKGDYGALQSCITHGITSLESYVNRLYIKFLEKRNQPIIEQAFKINFENKIDSWIPLILKKRFDKSSIFWRDYIDIKGLRDEDAVHPKKLSYCISLDEMAKYLNKYKNGVAGFLFQLHYISGEKIHSLIIRAMYAPNIIVIENR